MDSQDENTALQQRLHQYETAFEHLEQGVWIADGHNQVQYINTRMAEILGLPVAELIAHPHPLLTTPTDLSTPYEILHTRPDGISIWCQVAAHPMPDGR